MGCQSSKVKPASLLAKEDSLVKFESVPKDFGGDIRDDYPKHGRLSVILRD